MTEVKAEIEQRGGVRHRRAVSESDKVDQDVYA